MHLSSDFAWGWLAGLAVDLVAILVWSERSKPVSRSAGFFPMSAVDGEVIGIDFAPNLNGSTISGTPTVTGTNCTAAYVGHTAAGVVSVRVSAGTYAGSATATVVLADGRQVSRSVDVRFL